MRDPRPRSSPLDAFCLAVATGLYLSYIPFWIADRAAFARFGRWKGTGLVGTLLGWATLYALPEEGPVFGFCLAVGIAVACFVSGRAESRLGEHDDPRIIIDETVGYWTAVAWLPREPWLLLVGFVLFRVLDAVKGPPQRWLERLPGGLGVVADDVGAGVAANLLLRVLCRLQPGMLG